MHHAVELKINVM